MTAHSDIIRKGRKYDEVLTGARRVFLRDGFEGASVDDIAREAGVSKATLYSYFPDKRVLFLEIVSQQCLAMADQAMRLDLANKPAREVLTIAASVFLEFMLSPFAQKMHNLIHGEVDRFPELAHQFYETGPKLGKERMIMVLKALVDCGELAIEDFDFAAEQFGALCKADVWTKTCLQVCTDPKQEDIDRVIEGAVDMFMARYGTGKACS